MRTELEFEEPHGNRLVQVGLGAVALLLLGLFAWFVYGGLTGVQSVKLDSPTRIAVDMLPPPPPPPPPPEPEPEEVKPTDAPDPTPEPTPAKEAEAEAAPTTVNADAQAGSDAFGLQAGSGQGMGRPGSTGTCVGPNCGAGGGLGDSFYARYLSSALQEKVQDNKRVNRLVFSAEFAITVGPDGRVTDAQLIRGSGDPRRDALIGAAILSVRDLDVPPASIRWPQKITVQGRRA
ncbi:MAG: TonB C-terminal domain-containing protein [Sandaracinobacteroides sp.]